MGKEADTLHQRPALSLTDAMTAVKAMLEAAAQQPGRPVAIAVVDHHGDPIALACEAGANPALARQNAFKKAYTAVCMRIDTRALGERLAREGRVPADFGNPNFTAGAGGLVIAHSQDGVILGGIGVSGRPSGEEDEAIAQAGRRALEHSKDKS